jgi:tetratricopeptide (TPR) repeat protein
VTFDRPPQGRVFGMVSRNWRRWALAAIILLGLGGVLVGVWGRGHSDPLALAAEIRQALKNRQWSRAEALLTKLTERRAPTADDAVLRAELEMGRGRAQEAIILLTEIPESDPLAARARLVAGQIENSLRRARRAEALFLESLKLDPRLVPARRELILLYAMQARRSDVNAQFRALAELEPLSYDDVFLWTNCFEDLWVNETIRPHLERFLAADAEDRQSRLALAGVLVRYNQLEESEALLHILPDKDPDARLLRARIALHRVRLDEVRSLLDHGPADHVGLALLRGQLAVRMNDPPNADRQFRIALRLDPNNHEALEGLSLVLKQWGDLREAASIQKQADQWRHLRTLLQKSKTFDIRTDKSLLTQIGEACEALGQTPEARAWYRLALREDPLDPAVQKSLYRVRDRIPTGSGHPSPTGCREPGVGVMKSWVCNVFAFARAGPLAAAPPGFAQR